MKVFVFFLALLAFHAGAQDVSYPQKGPLEITVLFPAGTSADVTARMLADGMSKALGQRVLVVNRPGAGGAIGYRPPITPARCRSTTRRSMRWRACWSNRLLLQCAPTRHGNP